MKTVGDLLKSARQAKHIELEQIAAHTKISLSYLTAIEANQFNKLPPAAFTKGFLHTYANIVGVNPDTVLAMFRRDYASDDRGRIIPRSLVHPVKSPTTGITPTKITIGLISFISVIIVFFFARQIIAFISKPPLTISEPIENARLFSPIAVRGSTDAQMTVMVNNKSIPVSESGDFSTQLELSPGEHAVVVIVTSRNGKKHIQERFITVEIPPTPDM